MIARIGIGLKELFNFQDSSWIGGVLSSGFHGRLFCLIPLRTGCR